MDTTPHPYVELAMKAVHHYLNTEGILLRPDPLPEEFRKKAGVFVSIKKNKKLRGCIGTIAPTESDLAQEIISNAISAAAKDPRFSPVTKDEWNQLTFSVDVLNTPEKIRKVSELDCKQFGVIVKSNDKQGLLLPNLDGINSVEEQIRICEKKAGLSENDPVELFRFRVQRYH